MDLPKISVVTPAYRSADTIEQTIRSVLDQGYPNLEYIVIDGGSDDGTREILERYSDRLAYWVSEPDDGHYHAVMKGFAKATGTVYYWINSDDMLLPSALAKVGEIFRDHPIHWLTTTNPGIWDEQGGLDTVFSTQCFTEKRLLAGRHLPTPNRAGSCLQQESTFFSAELWRKSSHVLADYALAGDFALWCEMTKHAELVNCHSPLGGFRYRTGQRSEDYDAYVKDALPALQALRKHKRWSPVKTPIECAINLLPHRKLQYIFVKLSLTKAPSIFNQNRRGQREWAITRKLRRA